MIHCFNWCTDSLIIWWFIGPLSLRIIDSLVPWFCDSLIHWFAGWWICWFIGPLRLNHWFVRILIHWLNQWAVHEFVHVSVILTTIMCSYLFIRWCTSHLQHFIAFASQKHSFRPSMSLQSILISYFQNFHPGTCRALSGFEKSKACPVFFLTGCTFESKYRNKKCK